MNVRYSGGHTVHDAGGETEEEEDDGEERRGVQPGIEQVPDEEADDDGEHEGDADRAQRAELRMPSGEVKSLGRSDMVGGILRPGIIRWLRRHCTDLKVGAPTYDSCRHARFVSPVRAFRVG